jgi:hypothetical protein
MYIYIHTHIYTYIHTYIHTYIRAYICTCWSIPVASVTALDIVTQYWPCYVRTCTHTSSYLLYKPTSETTSLGTVRPRHLTRRTCSLIHVYVYVYVYVLYACMRGKCVYVWRCLHSYYHARYVSIMLHTYYHARYVSIMLHTYYHARYVSIMCRSTCTVLLHIHIQLIYTHARNNTRNMLHAFPHILRQTHTHTHTQTDRQTDRQIEIHKLTNVRIYTPEQLFLKQKPQQEARCSARPPTHLMYAFAYVCMYVCMCVCVYIYIYIYVCIYIFICIYV